jgi:hypothetical protein
MQLNFDCLNEWLPLSKSATKIWSPLWTIHLVQDWDQILIAPMNDRPCLRVRPKLSTPIQVVIGNVQTVQLSFNQLDERSPLFKSVTKILHGCPSSN